MQAKEWLLTVGYPEKPARLNARERAVGRWVLLKEHDRVLDVCCGEGKLLQKLMDRCALCACGLRGDEGARALRDRMPQADILFGSPLDIPWHDGSFDTVLLTRPPENGEALSGVLSECLRVLKPGGQIVMAARGVPSRLTADEPLPGRREGMNALTRLGCENVAFRYGGFIFGAVIGWKAKD